MGEKIEAKYEFGFEVPEEGFHVATLAESKVKQYDCTDGSKGYNFNVKCIIDGGPSDGLFHWENWRTRWPDGRLNAKAMSAMYGFMVKCGAKKDVGSVDTDLFEQEKFAREFESILTGKQIGLELKQYKDDKDTTRTRSRGYYTLGEAKTRMGTSKVNNSAPPKIQDKDGW